MPIRKRTYNRNGKTWTRWVATHEDASSGARDRVSKSFTLERDAKKWLDTQAGKRITPSSQRSRTVGETLDAWLEHGEAVLAWSPSHVERSRRVVAHDLEPLARLRLDRLSVEHVERLFAAQRQAGLSPSSIRLCRNALAGAVRLAMRRGWMAQGLNPARAASGPEVRRPTPKFLPPAKIPSFLAAIEADRLRPLYIITMSLALRPGEAIGLRWCDVDLKKLEVTVQQNIQKVSGTVHVRAPKADSVRTIPIPAEVADVFREQRKVTGKGELVFTKANSDEPVAEWYANKRLRTLLTNAGMDPVTLYQLRHTGATLLRALHVPIERIKEVMGHSSITTTMIYAHLADDLERDHADLLGDFLSSARTSAASLGGTTAGQKTKARGRKAETL